MTEKVLFARIPAEFFDRLQTLAKQANPAHSRPLTKFLRAELPSWIKRLEKKAKKTQSTP